MSKLPQYANVEFASIALDECDGARNIIELPDEKPKWNNINHYLMDKEFAEEVKSVLLGMQQVPLYVVLNEFGEIVQKGSNKQVNFEDIPGIVQLEEEKVEETKDEQALERVFCLDGDF